MRDDVTLAASRPARLGWRDRLRTRLRAHHATAGGAVMMSAMAGLPVILGMTLGLPDMAIGVAYVGNWALGFLLCVTKPEPDWDGPGPGRTSSAEPGGAGGYYEWASGDGGGDGGG